MVRFGSVTGGSQIVVWRLIDPQWLKMQKNNGYREKMKFYLAFCNFAMREWILRGNSHHSENSLPSRSQSTILWLPSAFDTSVLQSESIQAFLLVGGEGGGKSCDTTAYECQGGLGISERIVTLNNSTCTCCSSSKKYHNEVSKEQDGKELHWIRSFTQKHSELRNTQLQLKPSQPNRKRLSWEISS